MKISSIANEVYLLSPMKYYFFFHPFRQCGVKLLHDPKIFLQKE